MSSIMTVVQCWDDGVANDARLTEILRRHGARASFNLNAGLHHEMKAVYAGFTIANHSLTHPHLEQLPLAEARREIVEGRDRLQQFFGQPVLGFAYPYGSYNEAVMEAVREAGHVYARTVGNVAHPFPPENAMAFHPNCHFLADDFWARYEKARTGGVFYFWGHSYEMTTDPMWAEFEAKIARISADPAARWGELPELFAKK